MFRLPKTLDIITLFHKPSLPTSMRVLNLLKQASAAAGETATMDQSSNNNTEEKQRGEFELEVTEAPPTPDQLRNILDYVAPRGVKPGGVIRGARDRADALKKLKEGQEDDLVRPVVVDWTNGRAVVGGAESEILKLVRQGSSD
ncbi:hypothetical protein Egran_03153 [Elaphomyces granulatus]|uniref:Uncharacterized protein n=1 Tax=Elaphomyces granulatus TaxID=519963 RepID=A0A232LYD0_9EURO|nr:hypothetical protein Egran_03153 [Elaphomyces granulatus]